MNFRICILLTIAFVCFSSSFSLQMRCLIPLILSPALASVEPRPMLPDTLPFLTDHCLDVEIGGSPFLRFQANFFVANSSETIPGFLSLELPSNEHGFEDYGHITDFHEIDRASVGEIFFDLRGSLARRSMSSDLDRTLFMGAGPGSTFAIRAGCFMFNPLNHTSGQIVIAPSNPSDYAYEGEIYYAHNIGTSSWNIPVSVGIVGEDYTASTPHNCEIRFTSRYNTIPLAVLRLFFQKFQQLGIDVHWDINLLSFYIRSEFSASLIDQFPVLKFELFGENGSRIYIAELHPGDYVEYHTRPSLFATVMLQSFRSGSCLLSLTALGKSLIHFDAINLRVGFADPIDEI